MIKDESKVGPAGASSSDAGALDKHQSEGVKVKMISGKAGEPGKTNPVPNSEGTRFTRRQSGNPGGRPNGMMSRAFRRRPLKTLRNAEALMSKLVLAAMGCERAGSGERTGWISVSQETWFGIGLSFPLGV
jgi:hypothetical protein